MRIKIKGKLLNNCLIKVKTIALLMLLISIRKPLQMAQDLQPPLKNNLKNHRVKGRVWHLIITYLLYKLLFLCSKMQCENLGCTWSACLRFSSSPLLYSQVFPLTLRSCSLRMLTPMKEELGKVSSLSFSSILRTLLEDLWEDRNH